MIRLYLSSLHYLIGQACDVCNLQNRCKNLTSTLSHYNYGKANKNYFTVSKLDTCGTINTFDKQSTELGVKYEEKRTFTNFIYMRVCHQNLLDIYLSIALYVQNEQSAILFGGVPIRRSSIHLVQPAQA